MKHGSRIIAFVLIFCMMAGVLCAPAVPRAKADAVDAIYSDDLRDYFLELHPRMEQNINRFFDMLDTALDPDNNYYACALYNGTDYLICIYTSGNLSMKTWYSFSTNNYSGISRQPYNQNINVSRVAYLFFESGNLLLDFTSTNVGLIGPIAFDFSNPYYSLNYSAYPSSYNLNAYHVYTSRDISFGSGDFTMTQNFFTGSAPPVIEDFTLFDFWLGDRHYISITDQFWLSRMDPEKMGYLWSISAPYEGGTSIFAYDDIVLIPGGQNFINGTFVNVPDGGIYAVDITGYNLNLWDEIILSEIYEPVGFTVVARAINTPLNIQRPGGLPNSSTETWNYWYNYINNYPTSAVIPENLGEVLYGVTGTKSYPVEVLAPASIINAEITGPGAYFGEGYFQYHFDLNNNSALNYDILDVCVCSEQNMLQNYVQAPYSIRWWYDDSLSVTYKDIKDVYFYDLFDMYDIVMIVDDPEGFIHNINTSYVYTGDSDLGFQYSSSEISTQYTMKGFAFVTKKAIQKQLLFNFNDGITKSYKLMADYIEKRDLWDNSFLEWTTTLYTQIQTLDGRLDENGPIYRLLLGWNLNTWLSDIASKLDQIVRNTSEDTSEVNPWYLSLWNFVSQFAPSENDFTNALDEIVDVFDDLPLLPDPSPAPTIPLLPIS